MRDPVIEKKIYQNGLRFECTRCSNCCRHEPGYVFLTEEDLQSVAKATGTTRAEALAKYCRTIDAGIVKRISLKEKDNFDCIFWEDDGCTIYSGRPFQCRSYPFWSGVVASRDSWERESLKCPGINRGKTHSMESIERWIELRARSKLLP